MVVGDVMAGRRSVVTESELKFKCVGREFESPQLHHKTYESNDKSKVLALWNGIYEGESRSDIPRQEVGRCWQVVAEAIFLLP